MKREFFKTAIIMGMATLMISNLDCVSASAEWVNDSNNWNWIEDGGKVTGWKEIDNKWYYFNEDGIMNTGWLKYNDNWYSLSSSGVMETGWKEIQGKWYHFDSEGKMSVGWINDNGTWYFTNLSGQMETGTLGIDGVVYNFSDSGELLNNTESTKEMQNEASNVRNSKNDSNSRIAYVVTNNDSLNVRSDAEASSDIVGTLAKGTEIKIIDGEKNGFYPLILNGEKGWVSSKWISFKKTENIVTTDTTSTSYGVTSEVETKDMKPKDNSLGNIRDKEPNLNDEHYYSDDNVFHKVKLAPPFYNNGRQIKGNCTWYAWGRAWEITGIKPTDAGFIGNAYEWWEANKKSGKYQYGSEPRVGAIAVWQSNLPNSGGDGHVAVVEKIENGKIYISESTWNGVTFRYREIYDTNYLYGYIYLDKPNY